MVFILLSGLTVSSLLGIAGRMKSGLPAQWNHLFLDTFQRHTANQKPAQLSVVVDIDDLSLSAAGQWPWPRYRIGALIKAVADAKPAAIGLDILFSEPDRTSLNTIKKSFKQDFGLDMSFAGVPPGLLDNDGYLGRVLADTGAVGARYFYFDYATKDEISGKPAFHFTGKTELLNLNDAPGMLTNTYAISSQLKFTGFLNNQPDSDGMLRRMPLLIKHHGIIYPNLSLATYMRSQGLDSAAIDKDSNGPVIRVGKHSIPISRSGFAMMRFNGPSHLYPSISAVDILNGTFHPADLKGKIVFIGSSAAALNDLHSTIYDIQFPGLKTQAVVTENIMADRFVRIPTWSGMAIFQACIVTGLLISALFIRFREPLRLLLGTVILVAGILLLSILPFQFFGIFLSPGAPILVTAVLFTLFTATRFTIEKRHSYLWFKQLANARQVTMESMAAVAETRDPETGAHIRRTQNYVKAIADKLKRSGHFSETLSNEFIDLLFVSAPLHDIGKVGVPDNILLKPGKLTAEEFEIMKKHAEYGKNIIYSTAQKIEGNNFLSIAAEIASSHHEKWDGTGYPLGLGGMDIPLSGRIMVVGDVYDALISKRCYKPPFPHEEAIKIMRESRGKIFDPVILDAFFSIEDEVKRIAVKYQDESEIVLGDR
ncbi:MAG: CHASE2 domain-containing protein [Gallionella sp.]